MKAYKPKASNSSITMRYALMSLALSSVSYAVLFDHLSKHVSHDRTAMLIITYNIIAVGMMGIFALFADKVESKHTGVRLSVFLTVLGYFLPVKFGIDIKVVLLALGSSLFHAFASSSLLSRSEGKSRGIALFLAGQALGFSFSTFAGFAGHFFAPILMILAIAPDRYRAENGEKKADTASVGKGYLPLASLLLLMFAYALLSYEFSSFVFNWNTWYKTQAVLLAAVALGRAAGGFLSDIIGKVMTVTASAAGGTLLIFFCQSNKNLSLIGLFLLAMSLSPTVTSASNIMQNHPAFAFSLMSASAYLGQTMSLLIGFKRISMLFICASVIAVIAATELPLILKYNNESEEKFENEDI